MTTSDFSGAKWRKASSSASTGDCVELATWRKSSRSTDTGQCIELVHTEIVFRLRDSKNANGPMLTLTAEQGFAFLGAVKDGRIPQS
ncbi:DUF397 domain-containing protein [Kibdelosporangium banguiense]|uniref:DUF397 domain-containing protein n=1 Tax=Kibdelosporangium banguiense TaxID=1365924 RepID=UPI001AE5581A|nr:DUF397 domain-containing protein [Kibdelosporangium banguiense]